MSQNTKSLFELFPKKWKDQMDLMELQTILDTIESNLGEDLTMNQVVPEFSNIFRAFELCTFEKFRVLIIGQDPYPTPGHANGLAFSVEPSVRPLPKSLKNIYKELTMEGHAVSENGDLAKWAKQGVLLLNTALTTKKGEANAHLGLGWQKFMSLVFNALSKKKNLVGIFWGKQAQSWSEQLKSEDSLKLFAPHPSPLSAYRGFLGCNHFIQANEFLHSKHLRKIQW